MQEAAGADGLGILLCGYRNLVQRRGETENTDSPHLPHLLRPGGERRGEEAASQGADERASVQSES